jgi:signal peptidase II
VAKKLPLSFWAIAIIFLVLLLDQLFKFYIKTHYMLGEEYYVFGWKWFIIHFTENPGMAFGMQFSGNFGKLLLSLLRIIAIGAIIWYLVKIIKEKKAVGLIICISLIVAGALGNLIDSAFYGLIFSESYYQVAEFFPEGGGYAGFLHGKVVDMLYFPMFRGNFPQWIPFVGGNEFLFFRPVFNLADSSITTGVIALLVFQKRYFKKN